MNDAIVHFTIGSSPLITIFPYFILYNAHNRMTEDEKDDCKISFSNLCIILPFMYGLIFAMLYSCCGFIPRKYGSSTYIRFVICGAMTSVIISLILHYIFRIHTDWFHIENSSMYHIGTFIFYLVLFYSIGQWIRSQILYGPTTSSAPASPQPAAPQPSMRLPPKVAAASAKFDALAAANTTK